MIFPEFFWILLVAAGVFELLGFYKFLWFLSVGYGLAIFGIGVSLFVMALIMVPFSPALLLYLALALIMSIYGFRLGWFLLVRELKNASYKKRLQEVAGGATKKMPFPVMISMWAFDVILFFMQASPLFYRLANGKADKALVSLSIGVVISLVGLVFEAVADKQKSAQKKENPNMAATKGIFRMCRCPNYFGEILVWTGVFVSGIGAVEGWQWLIASLGYICITFIMVSGAKRLEIRQNKNYGDQLEYQEYVKKTPIIFPLIPLYHLAKPVEEKKEENK